MNFFRILLLTALATGALHACSEKQPAVIEAEPPAQINTAQLSGDTEQADGQTLIAEVAAGGIPTQYVAYFQQEKLTRIDETRQFNRGRGSYEFYGARLLRYTGSALDSRAPVLLEFSMTGNIEKSQSGSGSASAAQIEGLRSRAQLLRSHALAQRSTRGHSPH